MDAIVSNHQIGDSGWYLDQHGYAARYVGNKKTLQHRVVMAEVLGRELFPHENVHHINGDKIDNRPENLELWTKSQPAGQRVEDKIAWAIEFLAEYGVTVSKTVS